MQALEVAVCVGLGVAKTFLGLDLMSVLSLTKERVVHMVRKGSAHDLFAQGAKLLKVYFA